MVKTIVLKIKGMHCTSCAFNIDGELEDTEGVVESSTNYARAQAEVLFDDSKISSKKIIDAVANIGYTANIDEPN